MDGNRKSNAPIPSQTIAGNDRSPRVTGGQITPARAIPMGTVARIPTITSNGPPGR